jgi:sirohydrochlorin ferrochelatase
MTRPPLILVAHGTREPAGPREINRIAHATSHHIGVAVHPSYVDVIGPTVAEVLAALRGPVVVLPAFLASGYHVRHDLPAQVAAACSDADVFLAGALGPAPELAAAMLTRLREAGWSRGDRVLFAAAGSSDDGALAEVRSAATLLGRRCGQWLNPSFVTTPRPLTRKMAGALCTASQHVFIAPYLLAPGLFHRRLVELPVSAVAEPIGAQPAVIDLIACRYEAALRHGRSVA